MIFRKYRRLSLFLAVMMFIIQSSFSVYGMELINENDHSGEEEYILDTEKSEDNTAGSDYITEDEAIIDSGSPSDLTDEDKSILNSNSTVSSDGKIMRVSYINVGHGDSILIECGGEAVLVDGGEPEKGRLVSGYIKEKGYTGLKYVIATHPHNDHVGGLADVLSEFGCEKVLSARSRGSAIKNKGLTSAYAAFSEAVNNRGLTIEYPSQGTEYKIGVSDNKALIKILGPVKTGSEINNNSLAFMLTFGEKRFLFTGDSKRAEERDLIRSCGGDNLKCDVYKAAHHGLNGSSSKVFVDTIDPEYAVISCDKRSRWRSPGTSCIRRFRKNGIKTFRTDKQGTIIAVTDGKDIAWNVSPEF